MGDSTENNNDHNWWEFYIIRYAIGTVVGAAIVYTLFSMDSNQEVNDLLLLTTDIDDLKYFHFIFLAFYGLTYCYIASAPILVIHAARFLLPYHKGAIFGLVSLALFASIACFMVFSGIDLARSVMIFLGLSILVLQWCLAGFSIFKTTDNYKFYKQLATKRKADGTDIRESYKHLREHGNSFAIIFLEILLGIILVNLRHEDPSYPLWFLFIWILPAVFVWFIGTGLERKFAEDTE